MKKAAIARESILAAFRQIQISHKPASIGSTIVSSSSQQLTQSVATDYSIGMATLTIELPPHATQTHYNLRRWAEVLADRDLARVEGRIETDRHGQIISVQMLESLAFSAPILSNQFEAPGFALNFQNESGLAEPVYTRLIT